jgi:hypothetical protein
MQYKTITLELLEQHEVLTQHLRQHHLLLAIMERLAEQLRTRHLEIQAELQATYATAAFNEICSQALEMAVEELQIRMMAFSDRPFDTPEIMEELQQLLSGPLPSVYDVAGNRHHCLMGFPMTRKQCLPETRPSHHLL